MAITLGAGPVVNNNPSGGTSPVSVVLPGTTAGRSIVVTLDFPNHATATWASLTCSGESDLTPIGSVLRVPSVSNYGLQLFYLPNITTGGDKTITATASVSTDARQIMAMEVAGADTSSFLDAENGSTGTGSTASTSITTSTANDLIVVVGCSDSGNPTPGSGYTAITLANLLYWSEGEYDLDVGAAGVKSVDLSTAGGNWGIKAAAFKPAGAPAGGVGSLLSYQRNFLVRS